MNVLKSKLALPALTLCLLALFTGCPEKQPTNPTGNPLETNAGKAAREGEEPAAERKPVNTGGLHGTWETSRAGLEIELREDGTYSEQTAGSIDPSGATQGSYEVGEDGRLRLTTRVQGVELNRFYEFEQNGDTLRIRMVEMSNQHATKKGDELLPSASAWQEWTRKK